MPANIVTDVHSQLNSVFHRDIHQITNKTELEELLNQARRDKKIVSLAGRKHSMGGQQFVHDGILVDLSTFNKIIEMDHLHGLVKVEPGCMWGDIVQYLYENSDWSIVQKPTGADDISIGGSLSSNIHGRGLTLRPFIQDIESFEIIVQGEILQASRTKNAELFSLAVGGYGLFGALVSVTLRLMPRCLMQRNVEVSDIDQLIPAFEKRMAQGNLYGDFQFSIDAKNDDFLKRGILSTYMPVLPDVNRQESQNKLSASDWHTLLEFAHTSKTKAFEMYEKHYLKTNGQTYWSDLMQLSTYEMGYHNSLDHKLHSKGSEIITELYVPKEKLVQFMQNAAVCLRKRDADLIYGTIRLIEKDTESALPWAKAASACIIFNLHTSHGLDDLQDTAETFRELIDTAQDLEGSYYLTYHRFARKDQIMKSYSSFDRFLAAKEKYDPDLLFQTQWYRHCMKLFQE